MMHWLTKLLSRPAKQHPCQGYVLPRTRLGMEELTPRDLPSSHLLGSSLGSFFEAKQSSVALASLHSHNESATEKSREGHDGQCGADATYVATLANASGATGTASYLAGNNSLKVQVKGAAANSTLDIQLDGVSIGSLTTDSSGKGKVTLTNLTAVVNANSALTVGDLTGSFTQAKFSATLTGSASTQTGSAGYNALKHSLNLYITGATAKTAYNVLLDGVSVGTLTTNKSGTGRFHLDLTTLNIKSGTVVTITDSTNTTVYQGTFA